MARRFDRWLPVGVLLLAGLLIASAVLTYRNTRQVYDNSRWVTHTHEVLDALNRITANLNAANANRRAFILTGDERWREARLEAYDEARHALNAVAELTVDNPAQQQRIPRLQGLYRARRQFADNVLRERKEPAFGVLDSDGLPDLIDEMVESERILLRDRERATTSALTATSIGILISTLAGLALVALCSVVVRRQLRTPEQANALLAEQRELLHATLVSIGDGVIVTDAVGNVTFLNSVAEQLTAWKNDDARGRPLEEVFRIVNEQTRAVVENPARRALREGQIVGLANHTVLIAKDGTEWPLDDSAAPIAGPKGPTGAVLVFREITERKRAEVKIRQSEALYRAIGESIKYGVWVCEADGRNTYASPSFLQLVGLTQEQCSSFGWGDVLHPDDAERTIAAWQQCVRERGVWDIEHRFRGVDGQYHPLLARGLPILDEAGNVTCWVGINLDISRLKQAEEASRRRSEQLRRLAELATRLNTALDVDSILGLVAAEARDLIPSRAADARLIGDEPLSRGGRDLSAPLVARDGRTLGWLQLSDREVGEFSADDEVILVQLAQMASVALENARLVEELREQARRKDDFLTMLAHELRNPLAPIRTSLALVRRPDVRAEDVAQAHTVMARQLDHAVRLVDDLLDVGRITKGKLELRRRPVEVGFVLALAIETARPTIEGQEHTLTLDLPSEQTWLDADPARLAQVFSNLLTNAAKYTEAGGRITVTTRREGSDVIVAVADTGMGIGPDLLPRVFDLFVQAERSLSRSQGGLGIGLTLVRMLTEMHGGSVWVESAGPGQGSTFSVRLPVIEAPAEVDVEPTEPEPVAGRRLRILIVDDNRDAAASLTALLSLDGDEVRVAYDGAMGGVLANEYRPEVAILDLGLPGLDGLELARRIRTTDWGRSALLIALTGWGQEQDRRRSREAGFDHHLVKPVDPEELVVLLNGRR